MPVIPHETLRELVELRERVKDLEAELAELKNTKHEDEIRLREALGLTAGTTKMLLALARGGIMSREQLLYHGCANGEDNDIRLVDSQVKRIRQRVPWIKIRSHYGYGYELHPDSVKEVRALITGKHTPCIFRPPLRSTLPSTADTATRT